MRIVFMGTPDFASASLKKLIDERFDVVGVFTQPDKPKGRGMELCASPVKELALENGLPVFQPVKMRDGTALAQIKALEPDILVVVAYGRILPDDILAVPKYGAINVHGSLLPKYRGAAPIQWAVLNGDKITGVTTMYLASEMDTGDIIYTAETEIGEYETSGELFDRLKENKAVRIFHVTGVDGIEGAGDGFRLIGETWAFVESIFPYKRVFSKYELALVAGCINIQVQGGHLKKNFMDLLEPFRKEGDNKARQLLETLETFVLDAGMNSGKTSEFMGIHTNTVQYRLKKINEILGAEITGNRVIPGLTIALALRRLEDTAK